MSTYQSVDALQNHLANTTFARTGAPKKAAGRALGVLVELITFYMLRDWGLEQGLAIERGLPEYGNPLIRHNVEFSLHPSTVIATGPVPDDERTLTPNAIRKEFLENVSLGAAKLTKGRWLTRQGVVRHACVIAEGEQDFFTARLDPDKQCVIARLARSPFAMFECKRVGVEEGQKKGPQSIEKAKQGAYVARSLSGLQRVPRRDGTVAAIVEDASGDLVTHPDYYGFLRDAIDSDDKEALANVVLTVGVVSNHGNWFTAEDHNKEMRVLAQSYDWLLFLTDQALTEFIYTALQSEDERFPATQAAFTASHSGDGTPTTFTKVTIGAEADAELSAYFEAEQPWGRWFNVIAPRQEIDSLRDDLHTLSAIHGGN